MNIQPLLCRLKNNKMQIEQNTGYTGHKDPTVHVGKKINSIMSVKINVKATLLAGLLNT